jgi:hypothetical protein
LNKIFRYELRRLIWNKFFIGLLIINVIYAWYILTTETIAGVAYTAPFSLWSFGAYFASILPLTILTMLFLLSVYYSKKEKQVEILTTATPVNKIYYALVRCAAVTICFLIICAILFCLGIYFYITIFDYRNILPFLLPSVILMLPCLLFTLGFGQLVGRVHQGLLFALMILALIIGFSGFGGNFDFFGHWYFSKYPISLPVGKDGEPAFIISSGFWIARLVYLVTGGLLLTFVISMQQRKAKKA